MDIPEPKYAHLIDKYVTYKGDLYLVNYAWWSGKIEIQYYDNEIKVAEFQSDAEWVYELVSDDGYACAVHDADLDAEQETQP